MLLWAVIATTAVFILTVILCTYRRQVRKICRQLAFKNDHRTNMRLTASLPFPELNYLIDGINEIIDLSHEIELTSLKNENDLKETITNLSHDIRTPLTSMDGYFQLLAQCETEQERLHYTDIIRRRITVLTEMLEELFTYAKLQNGAYTLELYPLDFGKCVRDTVFSFYDEFQGKNIVPRIAFCEEMMPMIGNEEALHRTIQNIIKNAAEHGNNSISFGLTSEKSEAVFRCLNDVRTPDEIDTSKVFNQFYKADSARTHTSTGLGLYIAKGLVERMNGRIIASLRENIFEVEIRFPLLHSRENEQYPN